MKKCYAAVLTAAFGISLLPLNAGAQKAVKAKVKGTGETIKLKQSGSKWKVKETGERVKLKKSGSSYKVKGTDIKLKPKTSRAQKKAEKEIKRAEKALPASATGLREGLPAPDSP